MEWNKKYKVYIDGKEIRTIKKQRCTVTHTFMNMTMTVLLFIYFELEQVSSNMLTNGGCASSPTNIQICMCKSHEDVSITSGTACLKQIAHFSGSNAKRC